MLDAKRGTVKPILLLKAGHSLWCRGNRASTHRAGPETLAPPDLFKVVRP